MIKEINQDQFQEATSEGFVLVDCYGTHCGPCKMLSKVLEEMEIDYPFLNIVKINMDNNPEFGRAHRIMAVPTMFFMKDGEIKQRQSGLMEADQIMAIAGEYLY